MGGGVVTVTPTPAKKLKIFKIHSPLKNFQNPISPLKNF
jgi:hypothetical protein